MRWSSRTSGATTPSTNYALYYFYGFQAPPPEALPHWMEGPKATLEEVRSPYEMKRFLEEHGEMDYLNDVD